VQGACPLQPERPSAFQVATEAGLGRVRLLNAARQRLAAGICRYTGWVHIQPSRGRQIIVGYPVIRHKLLLSPGVLPDAVVAELVDALA
jgi:hypothetical protein